MLRKFRNRQVLNREFLLYKKPGGKMPEIVDAMIMVTITAAGTRIRRVCTSGQASKCLPRHFTTANNTTPRVTDQNKNISYIFELCLLKKGAALTRLMTMLSPFPFHVTRPLRRESHRCCKQAVNHAGNNDNILFRHTRTDAVAAIGLKPSPCRSKSTF